MKLLSKKDIGAHGEALAAKFLRRNGYRIIGRNVRCGHKELDLIAQDRTYILFVEVKTLTFDDPAEIERRPSGAVDREKRKNTAEAARSYLRAHPNKRCPRLDVIEVYLDRAKPKKPLKLHHIPAAFDARGNIH